MAQHLDDYSLTMLRLAVSTWHSSLLIELLAKIRKTLWKCSKFMTADYELEMLRKESIIRKELTYRIKATNSAVDKIENHRIQERLINERSRTEEPFKL